MKNLVQLAATIAQKAHAGQFRRDGFTPYIIHPYRIANKMLNDGFANLGLAIAWLHDVLEDTDETAESLFAIGIPVEVIQAVKALTHADDVSYEDYLVGVKSNHLACIVKQYDILDNLSDSPTDKQILKYSKALTFLLS